MLARSLLCVALSLVVADDVAYTMLGASGGSGKAANIKAAMVLVGASGGIIIDMSEVTVSGEGTDTITGVISGLSGSNPDTIKGLLDSSAGADAVKAVRAQ